MSKKLWWLVAPIPFICCGVPIYWLASVVRNGTHRLQMVSTNDPQLQKAIEMARKTLPMFKARLKSHEPGERFAIKAKFKSEAGPEYLWLKDPKIAGDGFDGTVDQEPALYRKIKKGDRVHVAESDVYDWMVQRKNGDRAGAFTEIQLSQEAGR
ncbi:MAG TPA: DUF2314 domain-containing protein [Fimbriimonas sp.]|nr:DUF2314 domain-containing protein [Fimbriimonas sp.]